MRLFFKDIVIKIVVRILGNGVNILLECFLEVWKNKWDRYVRSVVVDCGGSRYVGVDILSKVGKYI